MNTPNHRHQMRHKGQTNLTTRNRFQALNSLGEMTMTLDTIGLEIISGFGQQCVHFGFATGTGNTGFAICDQRALIHQWLALREQWRKTQLHRSGITAGQANHTRCTNGIAIDFRQAIDGFRQNIGATMGHAVPLLENGRVFDAEICSEINHSDASIQ